MVYSLATLSSLDALPGILYGNRTTIDLISENAGSLRILVGTTSSMLGIADYILNVRILILHSDSDEHELYNSKDS